VVGGSWSIEGGVYVLRVRWEWRPYITRVVSKGRLPARPLRDVTQDPRKNHTGSTPVWGGMKGFTDHRIKEKNFTTAGCIEKGLCSKNTEAKQKVRPTVKRLQRKSKIWGDKKKIARSTLPPKPIVVDMREREGIKKKLRRYKKKTGRFAGRCSPMSAERARNSERTVSTPWGSMGGGEKINGPGGIWEAMKRGVRNSWKGTEKFRADGS